MKVFTVAFFVIGNIIGSGFFMMPSRLAPIGLNMLYSWAITCFIALTFSFIFGRLYIIFPDSSLVNDYYENFFLKQSLAVFYWISCIIGNVAVFVTLVASFNIPNIVLLGSFILLLMTLVNHFCEYETLAKVEIILSFLKFFLLIIVPVIFFILAPNMFKMPKAIGKFDDVVKIGITSLWAFIGIETAAVFGSGKDARDGLIIGVLASTVLYVAISLFVIGSVPMDVLKESSMPFVLLAKYSGYDFLQKYLSYLISFTIFVSLYGWIAGTSKMALINAKSGLFPKQFLIKSPSGLSFLGLWGSNLITYLLFLSVSFMNVNKQFDFITDLCVYVVLALYAMYAIALFNHSKKILDKIISILAIIIVFISFVV